jgi:hypothetical protein
MTEEVQGLVDACRKSRNTTLADLVEFALLTGVRRASRSGSHRLLGFREGLRHPRAPLI